MGLVIFGALAVYLIVLVTVTWLSYRWAVKHGLPRGKCWLAAGGGFLLVYLPVFWDHIPTVVAHKYYCEKEAGFWVYKTADQWKAENPGVAETLKPISSTGSHGVVNSKAYQIYSINDRISWYRQITNVLMDIRRYEDTLRDMKSDEIIAREIRFQSGRCSGPPSSFSDLKFWLIQCQCSSSNVPFINSQGMSWSRIYNQFSKVGAE